MKARIKKHIEKQDFVKVYIVDHNDLDITHFEGIIFEQTDKFVLMNDTTDFSYDGLIVLRKSDISEIKHSDNEKFLKHILDSENITDILIQKKSAIDFKLGGFKEMFTWIKNQNRAVIVESKYSNDDRFQIGPINEVLDKKVRIDHFNACGEYDLKPVSAKFKEITFFRIDSPYCETFYKYAKRVD